MKMKDGKKVQSALIYILLLCKPRSSEGREIGILHFCHVASSNYSTSIRTPTTHKWKVGWALFAFSQPTTSVFSKWKIYIASVVVWSTPLLHVDISRIWLRITRHGTFYEILWWCDVTCRLTKNALPIFWKTEAKSWRRRYALIRAFFSINFLQNRYVRTDDGRLLIVHSHTHVPFR